MARKKGKKLPAELTTKIRWEGPDATAIAKMRGDEGAWGLLGPLPWDDVKAESAEIRRSYFEEVGRQIDLKLKKLFALAEHYGIDTADIDIWPLLLAWKLAEEHVEGFATEFEKPAGRPRKWTPEKLTKLLANVELIKRSRGCSQRRAAQLFHKQIKHSELDLKSFRSVESRLIDARNPSLNMFMHPVVPKLLDLPASRTDSEEKRLMLLISVFAEKYFLEKYGQGFSGEIQ